MRSEIPLYNLFFFIDNALSPSGRHEQVSRESMKADLISPPPPLSSEEHAIRATEEQLLRDGRQWLRRAADLYTQTPKIKIWVPVLGSILMTSYYMYTMHANAAASQPAAMPGSMTSSVQGSTPGSAPVAVAEEISLPKAAAATVATSAPASEGADDSDAELLKRAHEAHGGQQPAEEAALLQKVFDRSHSAQLVCPAIGKAYERAGQIDLSIQSFERCAALSPGDMDTTLAFAHALQAKSDFNRAAGLYRQSLQKDPGNLDAQSGLALIALRQNRLQEAGQTSLAILQKAPDDTDALLIAGIVAWRQAKLPEAERIFSRGVTLDDRRADFHAFLGRVAEAQRRPQQALQEYERSLALDPNDSEIADRRDRLRDAR